MYDKTAESSTFVKALINLSLFCRFQVSHADCPELAFARVHISQTNPLQLPASRPEHSDSSKENSTASMITLVIARSPTVPSRQ
jgi:hypothetical protein